MFTVVWITISRLFRVGMFSKYLLITAVSVYAVSAWASDTTYADLRAWLTEHAYAPADGVRAGNYLRDDLSKFRPYLPAGFAVLFDFSNLTIELQDTQHYQASSVYRSASEQFSGTAQIASDGRLESYTVGQPFTGSQIEEAAPDKAGYMVAWNHIFRWQNYGYATEILMSYVDAKGEGGGLSSPGLLGGGTVTRTLTVYYHLVLMSKLAQKATQGFRLDASDKSNVHQKEYIEFLDPFDVAGTKFVIERSLDPMALDQAYSYIAGERRVRRLSAKERADGFMGSDMTLDDSEGFSGRILDYSWEYLGKKVIMHVSDSKHAQAEFFGLGSNVPHDRWQLRPCYVVEIVSKWEEAPFGRKILFIDAESFNIVTSLIFDRSDSFWKTVYTMYERSNVPPGSDGSVHRWAATVSIDFDKGTSTVAREAPDEQAMYEEYTVAAMRRLFDISNLTKGR